jgi:hypothetical protein
MVWNLTSDNAVESLLEPSDGLLGLDLVGESNSSGLGLSSGNSSSWSAHDDEAVGRSGISFRMGRLGNVRGSKRRERGQHSFHRDTNHTYKSIPKIPIPGSYLIPRSMCSSIPKPKFPVSEKFLKISCHSVDRRGRRSPLAHRLKISSRRPPCSTMPHLPHAKTRTHPFDAHLPVPLCLFPFLRSAVQRTETSTHRFLSSYSLTFNARSKTSSALGPRMVT